MIKFLRFGNGALLNVNDVREIWKGVNLYRRHSGKYSEGNERVIKATIEIQANGERCTFIDVRAYAPLKEDETWNNRTGEDSGAVRRINDILDTMITILVDKMNDEDEKIISIDTRFLEDAVKEEVERG